MKSRLMLLIVLMLGGLMLPQVAQASSLTLTFAQPVQSVQPGGLLTFVGTLSYTGTPGINGDPVLIFGDSVATSPGFIFYTPDPNFIMLDDSSFFFLFPSQMSSDGSNGPSSFTSDFFTIAVGSLVTPGTYFGSFDILGDDFSGNGSTIASAPFEIDIVAAAAVPEPASVTLLLTGAGCAGLGFLRKKLSVPAVPWRLGRRTGDFTHESRQVLT